MLLDYIRMKKNEWKVKAKFFEIASALIDEHEDVFNLLKKMYDSLKDVPSNDLREEFISNLVRIIHEENQDNNE